MTGNQFRALREASGMSLAQWGAALGYSGRNVRKLMTQYEMLRGEAIPPGPAMRVRNLLQTMQEAREDILS